MSKRGMFFISDFKGLEVEFVDSNGNIINIGDTIMYLSRTKSKYRWNQILKKSERIEKGQTKFKKVKVVGASYVVKPSYRNEQLIEVKSHLIVKEEGKSNTTRIYNSESTLLVK
jgi:hypothetical protein